MKKNILLIPDAAPGTGPTTPPPLTADSAGEKIAELTEALKTAEAAAALLLNDPHFRKCPFVAAIRGPAVAAMDRMEHLVDWLAANPVPVAKEGN